MIAQRIQKSFIARFSFYEQLKYRVVCFFRFAPSDIALILYFAQKVRQSGVIRIETPIARFLIPIYCAVADIFILFAESYDFVFHAVLSFRCAGMMVGRRAD